MRRLHTSLKEAGVDSKVLHIDGKGNAADNGFIQISKPTDMKRMNRCIHSLTQLTGLHALSGVRSSRIKKMSAYQDADILHIHRMLYVISYLGLPSLTKDKPSVLTLCDAWALTGRCYHSLDCERWKNGCGTCPHQNIFPSTTVDWSHYEWLLKKWAYGHSKMVVVAKSRWMQEMLRESILKLFPVYWIPNGIDVNSFKPLEKKACRKALGIPNGKKVLMLIAVNQKNYVKGGDLILKALEDLPNSFKKEIILFLAGTKPFDFKRALGIETLNLGYLDCDSLKALAYSTADLFICPSRVENFPNVVLESMSCGTPVVAFRVGGIPDCVHPYKTGYLAKPFDTKDLSRGIIEIIEDQSLREHMRDDCRSLMVRDFSKEKNLEKYLNLYKSLLDNP